MSLLKKSLYKPVTNFISETPSNEEETLRYYNTPGSKVVLRHSAVPGVALCRHAFRALKVE
jgi:hypothetical protein